MTDFTKVQQALERRGYTVRTYAAAVEAAAYLDGAIDGKTVEATKVSRVDGNKEQIAWIAPGMPVPVRLLQREGGKDALDLTIKSLR